ncbi:helitron_like_N domain-containing protein [Nephila pilipes]|uniref:Helitron_like_N domain-containing protein n=1 Tax=Nephila pilipes TaxID=299642 RepID=A0A8X6QFN4_NEPPI|nr:helitron_like_N domain-containing protein [Nephila pilipes]
MLRRCLRLSSCGDILGCISKMKLHTNAAKILYSSFDKDLPNPNLPTPLSRVIKHDTDILLEQLRKAKTIERLLILASSHLDVMNSQHVVTCLQNIYELSKTQEQFDSQHLLENTTFQSICSRLMKIIRILDSQELITVYKILSNYGVRNNTYVMQSTLKMLGAHLNDMSLGQLTFLHFLLSKQKHNPLVDGLRLALPLVLQVQIEQQLDTDNMTQVIDCLQLACRSKLKLTVIEKIIETVFKKAQNLSPTNAISVIFSLLSVDAPVNGYKELLNYSFELISQNLDIIDSKHILPILRHCSNKSYYQSRFFFEVSKKIDSENWNLEKTWETARIFKKLRFCPENFMDHFSRVICSEAYAFVNHPQYSILHCVEILTTSGYQPLHLQEVLSLICNSEKKKKLLKDSSPLLFVKFLSCLAMLGKFPQEHLSEILHENYLYNVWSFSRKHGRNIDFERYLCSLVWSLEVYDQLEYFRFPSTILKSLRQSVCERHENFNYPLQKFIENGLGGTQFLQSGIFTQNSLLIDHVLAMRSGNYPVSFHHSDSSHSSQKNQVAFVEDINLPPDAKIVAVITADEDKYLRDPEVIRCYLDIQIRCLKKKKFCPVVVNYNNWKNLPDREKIPYLMREIKDAAEEDCTEKKNTLY